MLIEKQIPPATKRILDHPRYRASNGKYTVVYDTTADRWFLALKWLYPFGSHSLDRYYRVYKFETDDGEYMPANPGELMTFFNRSNTATVAPAEAKRRLKQKRADEAAAEQRDWETRRQGGAEDTAHQFRYANAVYDSGKTSGNTRRRPVMR